MKTFNSTKLWTLLIFLIIVELALTMYLADWRSTFWGAVEERNYKLFVEYLLYFIVVAFSLCFVGSYESYLVTLVSLSMRTKLTRKALRADSDHIAIAQIKQEDCLKYPQLLISLIVNGIRNVCLLIIYGYFVMQVSGFYLIYPLIYAILTSTVGYKLAFPLIHLNYMNQNLEAVFRQQLSKINYSKAFVNNFKLAKSTKILAYWQIGVNQLSIVLPYICLAGAYFSFKITFGVFMQVASALNNMTDCLSFFLNSFNEINKLLSCRKRLKEIKVI